MYLVLNQFESTLNMLQLQHIIYHLELSRSRSNLPCYINALLQLECRSCLKISVILVQHVGKGCRN